MLSFNSFFLHRSSWLARGAGRFDLSVCPPRKNAPVLLVLLRRLVRFLASPSPLRAPRSPSLRCFSCAVAASTSVLAPYEQCNAPLPPIRRRARCCPNTLRRAFPAQLPLLLGVLFLVLRVVAASAMLRSSPSPAIAVARNDERLICSLPTTHGRFPRQNPVELRQKRGRTTAETRQKHRPIGRIG